MKLKKIALRVVCGMSLVAGPAISNGASTNAGVEGGSTNSTANTGKAINEGSNKAEKKNNVGQILSYALAAAEAAYAAYNVPPCSTGNGGACANVAIFSIMALQSAQQGASHGASASAARFTASATDGAGDTFGATDDSMNKGNGAGKYITASDKTIKMLQDSGIISPDKSKVITPDGKSYKVADMTSAAAMQAAGLPKASIDAAMESFSKMEKKALEKLRIGSQTAANGYEEGGGGGGGSGVPIEEDPGMAVAGAGGAGLGKEALTPRDPSSLAAGMSKNYNGEPIGVAADSIFLMMNRRYKVKESQDSFFGINDLLLKK